MSHELIDDVAAVLHPLPRPLPADAEDTERDVSVLDHELAAERREETATRLRRLWEERGADPIDHTLQELADDRDQVERRIARVVALAREFTDPRRYTLDRLGLDLRVSASAVRGAYDHIDAEAVASETGRRTTLIQSPAIASAADPLIEALAERTANDAARAEVAGVAAVLRTQGWTLFPPVARTPNPKFARRYLRWERRWPHGTVISLYQEPGGYLAVHAKMATDDPRFFSEAYGIDEDGDPVTAADIAALLTAYAERVARHDAERPRVFEDEAADLRPVDFGPLFRRGPQPRGDRDVSGGDRDL